MEINTDRLVKAAEDALVRDISRGGWIALRYNEFSLAITDLEDIFARVDIDKVKDLVRADLEEKIAQKIMHSMATEVGRDVKRVMMNIGTRETFRAFVRDHIEDLVGVRPTEES